MPPNSNGEGRLTDAGCQNLHLDTVPRLDLSDKETCTKAFRGLRRTDGTPNNAKGYARHDRVFSVGANAKKVSEPGIRGVFSRHRSTKMEIPVNHAIDFNTGWNRSVLRSESSFALALML
jgi:hypothetical protein